VYGKKKKNVFFLLQPRSNIHPRYWKSIVHVTCSIEFQYWQCISNIFKTYTPHTSLQKKEFRTSQLQPLITSSIICIYVFINEFSLGIHKTLTYSLSLQHIYIYIRNMRDISTTTGKSWSSKKWRLNANRTICVV